MSIDDTIVQDTKKDLKGEFRDVFIKSNIQYYKNVFDNKKNKISSQNSSKSYFQSVIYGKNKIKLVDKEYDISEGIIMISTDHNGVITYTNKKFCEISGYSRDELVGNHCSITKHDHMPKSLLKGLIRTLLSGKEWHGITKDLRKDGRYYWLYSHISPIFSDTILTGYTAIRRPALATELIEAMELYKA